MEKKKILPQLFLTLLKIGAFTFGGGYAMVALIRNELVEKKKWMNKDEFIDMVAIAESTPGPIAINSATYIGYRMCGFPGALVATLGVCIPSFVIIFLISLFFDAFISLKVIEYAFRGIQACVAYLILSAGIKMIKELKRSPLELILLILTLISMITLTLFAISFSSIFYILIGGAVGLSVYFISNLRKSQKGGAEK